MQRSVRACGVRVAAIIVISLAFAMIVTLIQLYARLLLAESELATFAGIAGQSMAKSNFFQGRTNLLEAVRESDFKQFDSQETNGARFYVAETEAQLRFVSEYNRKMRRLISEKPPDQ
jgi:hypothetical protein